MHIIVYLIYVGPVAFLFDFSLLVFHREFQQPSAGPGASVSLKTSSSGYSLASKDIVRTGQKNMWI